MATEENPRQTTATDSSPSFAARCRSCVRAALGNTAGSAFSYLRTLRVIYGKELKSFLCTPFGWVILACTMGLQGFWLQTVLQIMSNATGDSLMYYMLNSVYFWFYFIFIFALITMRSFAEEERMGTLEGLLTAPVTTTQIVLGKYLAAYTFYLILWVPMMLYPWMSHLGNVYTSIKYGITPEGVIEYRLSDWFGGFSILALTGLFFTALGMACSAMTRSQIIAGILCSCMMISYYFLGRFTELWGEFPAAPIFHYLSCTEHVGDFSRGLVDTRPVVLYVTLALLTLSVTRRIVDYRRWRR